MPRTLAFLPLVAVLAIVSQTSAQSPIAATALNARLPETTLEDVPFDAAVDWLTEQSGLSIHVRWDRLADYGIERDKPVSLKARNLTLSKVLWLLMNQIGGGDVRLAYRASGTLLILSTEEDLGRELLTRVYDVRDLLDRAPRFANATRIDPTTALQPEGGSAAFSPSARTDDPAAAEAEPTAAFVRMITDAVEPDSWAVNGGRGRITLWRGQIVVNNTIAVHQRLAGPIIEDE